jgi:hypothetical protein
MAEPPPQTTLVTLHGANATCGLQNALHGHARSHPPQTTLVTLHGAHAACGLQNALHGHARSHPPQTTLVTLHGGHAACGLPKMRCMAMPAATHRRPQW